MFFDLEDYATTYRSTIDPNCVNPNIPKVDNSSVECSQIISTNCVVTAKGFPYLGIGSGETVTSVIEKIKEKFKSLSFSILNLGTGIGLLKSFSGGVLSAKSIKAGNNIVLTEANDTITINATGGGSGGGVVDITHSNLVIAKNASTLSPGTFYRITDFRTMYDQPDFDTNGVAKTSVAAKQGPVEPIIVLALKNNLLSTKAEQEAYPKDTIEYILEFTTPVNLTVTKGRIIYRRDEWGNETDFDHRNVVFKRYLHPILQQHLSYKDTSLASIEVKFLQTPTSSKIKSVGYFSLFNDSYFSGFDLPNNVITSDAYNSTIDVFTRNCTFKYIIRSEIKRCSNSIIELSLEESILSLVLDSTMYYQGSGFNIVNSNISEVYQSTIGVSTILGCEILKIYNVNIGIFNANSSQFSINDSGILNQIGLPTGSFSITNSKIKDIIDMKGSLTVLNTYLNRLGRATYSLNTIDNVTGGTMFDCIIKPNQTISDLNILGNLESEDLSASTIIYDTTLSKEIIKHPNGLYIKHYDQFGAAVINNVNA